jgi:hypothetical protein
MSAPSITVRQRRGAWCPGVGGLLRRHLGLAALVDQDREVERKTFSRRTPELHQHVEAGDARPRPPPVETI